MDKENVVHPYSGILFTHKRVKINTRYIMNKLWKYLKWKKPDTKCYILTAWFILNKIFRVGKLKGLESRLMFAWNVGVGQVVGEKRDCLMGVVSFWGNKTYLELDSNDNCTTEFHTLKWLKWEICVLYS